jgi:hypothetical protein
VLGYTVTSSHVHHLVRDNGHREVIREIHVLDGKWTESVAVGGKAFVTATKEILGVKGEGRPVVGGDASYGLRESPAAHKGIFGDENAVLRPQNEYFSRNSSWNSI